MMQGLFHFRELRCSIKEGTPNLLTVIWKTCEIKDTIS